MFIFETVWRLSTNDIPLEFWINFSGTLQVAYIALRKNCLHFGMKSKLWATVSTEVVSYNFMPCTE